MTPDYVTRFLLALIAFALSWLALRPHVLPPPSEAAREIVTVNLEQVGGRFLTGGVVPVRCIDRP